MMKSGQRAVVERAARKTGLRASEAKCYLIGRGCGERQ
jgi:hypothetical protein